MKTFDANFIVNAGLKDIVGRGLIYDDNVALIELIKNAKDSGSDSVHLYFESKVDSGSREKISEIRVCDYGKGMTETEILGKWLNIAYSEKKDSVKVYAGNKGVGRFSCDRLGEVLILYTKSENGEYIKLPIEWMDFEKKGQKDEISKINLQGQILDKNQFLQEIELDKFDTGTVLKIQKLRTDWSSKKIKKLIGEMEKFSPSLDEDFEVFLQVDKEFDKLQIAEKRLKNGKINNNLLSKIAFKTTYIKSFIDSNGDKVHTDLFFQGEKIFSYLAHNPYKWLKDIKVEIHYLDTISKAYFTKNIGMSSTEYGSIFLFYNGFRISPYGNPKNDWLGLDQRKSQGTLRNLGTREIFGRIDIDDSDDTFSVITSREGLAHNDAFYDLSAYDEHEKTTLNNGKEEYGYVTVLIRQLENFVVGGLNWNRLVDKLGTKKIVTLDDVKRDPERFIVKDLSSKLVSEILEKLLKSNLKLDEFTINKILIDKIQKVNLEKFEQYKKDFLKRTNDKSIVEITPQDRGVLKNIIENQEIITRAALEELDITEKFAYQTLEELEIAKESNRYLLASRSNLSTDAEGLIHTIKLVNSKISLIAIGVINDLLSKKLEPESLLQKISNIQINSDKALKLAILANKTEIDSDIEDRNIDVGVFVKEYLLDVAEEYCGILSFSFGEIEGNEIRKVNVLGLSIVLDNLISNSIKWGAKNIRVDFYTSDKTRKIVFSDDGDGLSEKFAQNPESIFEIGIRDNPKRNNSDSGSGVGLFHVKNLLDEMESTKAYIKFLGNGIKLSGAAFELGFE